MPEGWQLTKYEETDALKIIFDDDSEIVSKEDGETTETYRLDSADAFKLITKAYLRCGWDNKYVYSFSWLGRPIIQLPDDLIMEVVKCKDNNAVRQVGIEWCIEQSKELVAQGVPILHYYSMGKSDNIKAIAASVF